jgi:C-terminal processing protease CtpA/Prc
VSGLDAARRADVVDRVLRVIEERYVDPEVAAEMAALVRGRLEAGAYDAAGSGGALAARLTQDLREAGEDALLEVVFHREPRGPADEPAATPPDAGAHANFGFERVERMARNVGLIVVRGFHPAEADGAAAAATAAMTLVAHTGAVLFDLRENTGGAPSMVTFLASFLFDEPVHLNTVAGRPGAPERQSWTYAHVPGPRFGGPVLMLVSRATYGAAEGFAYHLQARARARVVGERTRGLGRIGSAHRVDPSFDVWISTARSVNPVTGTSWHGTGVVPDIEVPAGQALRAAHAAATRD